MPPSIDQRGAQLGANFGAFALTGSQLPYANRAELRQPKWNLGTQDLGLTPPLLGDRVLKCSAGFLC